jgi:hypothetical protein
MNNCLTGARLAGVSWSHGIALQYIETDFRKLGRFADLVDSYRCRGVKRGEACFNGEFRNSLYFRLFEPIFRSEMPPLWS